MREIHHRIKNHIQGIAGLLLGHARRKPELEREIRAAVTQLQAVAEIHGLQSASRHGVKLGEIIGAICKSFHAYAAGPEGIQLHSGANLVSIDDEEAVPVALIVNELSMNAIKHGKSESGQPVVNVEIKPAGAGASVCVSNLGRLANPDMTSRSRLTFGLSTVRSLLPAQGATFEILQRGEQVYATLTLQPPIVVSAPALDAFAETAQDAVSRRAAA